MTAITEGREETGSSAGHTSAFFTAGPSEGGDRTGRRVWPGLPRGDVKIGNVIWEQWDNPAVVPA